MDRGWSSEKCNRIISLTPTTTETLFALGLGGRLVGVTAACDFPPAAGEVASIGPVFRPDPALIAALKPDLALAQGAYFERYRADLADLGVELLILESANVDRILDDFLTVGRWCGAERRAADLVDELTGRLAAVSKALAGLAPEDKPTTLRLLEAEPAIVSGPVGFMTDCISRAGGRVPDYGPEVDPGGRIPQPVAGTVGRR